MATTSTTPTKADLQDLLDQVADAVSEALDPVLSREDVVSRLQDIDGMLDGFGTDDEDDSDDDTDEDNEDEA